MKKENKKGEKISYKTASGENKDRSGEGLKIFFSDTKTKNQSDFTASGSSITYLLDGNDSWRNVKTRGGKAARPSKLSSSTLSLFVAIPFDRPSRSFTSGVIGRGRAFHLYGPACASVDRASFSCIKARCIFRVFRLPQPPTHSLSRLSIPSSATDPPTPPTSPLHHLNHSTWFVSNRDARCTLCSQRRRTTDSRVRFSETLVERDGCHGA